jgi:hypothetical protein
LVETNLRHNKISPQLEHGALQIFDSVLQAMLQGDDAR